MQGSNLKAERNFYDGNKTINTHTHIHTHTQTDTRTQARAHTHTHTRIKKTKTNTIVNWFIEEKKLFMNEKIK